MPTTSAMAPTLRRRSTPLLLSAVSGLVTVFTIGIAATLAQGQATPGVFRRTPVESPGMIATATAPTTRAATARPGNADADADETAGDALDPAWSSAVGGISVRPPSGGVMRQVAGNEFELVRFVSEEQKWQFVISRVTLPEPMPLVVRDTAAPAVPAAVPNPANANPPAAPTVGFAETLAADMKSDTPGQMVKFDLMPIAGNDGALLATRFTEADGSKRFMQQAIIHRTDKSYYVLSYTTPLSGGELEQDPAARKALATFGDICDSVQLLDQEQITRDQEDRLIRTRALMVNWSPQRLQQALVPEQWLRLVKEGKDIGYTYIVEEVASDVPRKGTRGTNADTTVKPVAGESIPGVRVGIRSRSMPDASFRVDTESWAWVRADKKQESFRNLMKSVDGNNPPNFAMEIGTCVNRDRVVPVWNGQPNNPNAQIVRGKDEKIDLQIWSTSKTQQLPPLTREVPPFYLPQALGHLLPRLLPLNDPKGYLFATYVSERRAVVMRYVDVLPPTRIKLPGAAQEQTVVPIQDRAGFEGSVTTHYMTLDGHYLGSVNADAKVAIVSSNAETIRKIWADADLKRPEDVDEQQQQQPSPQANPQQGRQPARQTPPGASDRRSQTPGVVRPR